MEVETAVRSAVQLRAHQETAVRAAAASLRTHGRAQVIMPCGTGKTLVGIGVRTALGARLVLVVVPTLALIRQSARRWREACVDDPAVLFACSDQTVADEEDASTVERAEVAAEIRAPVTTETGELAAILRAWSARHDRMGIAFATYASVERALRAADEAGVMFDLTVADEAHHCAGRWSSPAAVLARYGTGDTPPIRARLFLTATPRAISTDGPAATLSMDDANAFGPVAYRLSTLEAIQSGLLADYQIAVVGVSAAEAAGLSAGRDLLNEPAAARVLSPALVAATIALGRAMQRTRLRRIVTFHSRVRDARTYAAVVPTLLGRAGPGGAALRISAAAAYADMPARERQLVIDRFTGANDGHAVIASNVRCLAEGIDLPSLDAVLFADPRHGLVDVIQAVGRVMRPHPGKTRGMVILPLLLPEDGRPMHLVNNERFTNTLRVLRILRDHDSRVAAQLDQLRTQSGQYRRLPSWLAGSQLPEGPLRFIVSDARALAAFSTFTLRLVAETTAPWHERYGSLQRWAADHGHSRIPLAARHDGTRLGGWAHEQRTLKARGLLAPERAAALERLPGWTWSPHDAAWERAFEMLTAYVREHGTPRVPQTYRSQGFALGAWVKAQRELFGKGRLPQWRADRLAALPGWSWRIRPRVG